MKTFALVLGLGLFLASCSGSAKPERQPGNAPTSEPTASFTTQAMSSGIEGDASFTLSKRPLADAELWVARGTTVSDKAGVAHTDGNGHFRITLAPGTYTIFGPCPPTACQTYPSMTVVVTEGRFTEVSLGYDR